MLKDLRGSGSKENVGRKKNPYITKTLSKRGIPIEIYDICLSLVDAEVLKFKKKWQEEKK